MHLLQDNQEEGDADFDDFDVEDIQRLAQLNMRREQMLMYIEDIREKLREKQDIKAESAESKPGRRHDRGANLSKHPAQSHGESAKLPPSSYENVITFEGENFDVIIPASDKDRELNCLKFSMIPRILGCVVSKGRKEERYLFQISVKAQKTYETAPWESYFLDWRDLKERRIVGSINIAQIKRVRIDGAWLGMELDLQNDRGRGENILSLNCAHESLAKDFKDSLEFLVEKVRQRQTSSLKWGEV